MLIHNTAQAPSTCCTRFLMPRVWCSGEQPCTLQSANGGAAQQQLEEFCGQELHGFSSTVAPEPRRPIMGSHNQGDRRPPAKQRQAEAGNCKWLQPPRRCSCLFLFHIHFFLRPLRRQGSHSFTCKKHNRKRVCNYVYMRLARLNISK